MNKNKKRDDSNICYTGINSVKTGNYTNNLTYVFCFFNG